jgi:L-alanine-DL-glutamate epimerase-like enolase superfamily enzyme
MRIARVEVAARTLALARPYSIAYASTEDAPLAFVRVVAEDGTCGVGCAAPVPETTGEAFSACRAALERAERLVGHDAAAIPPALELLEREFDATPAARAALDMALHDLVARLAGAPLVEHLGRVHGDLPTSVTIGVMGVRDALEEAGAHLARGIRALKVKVGTDLDADVELLARLRERVGPHVALRADANAGYRASDVERFCARTADLGLELLEQPAPPAEDDALRRLSAAVRRRLAADESLHGEADALRLAQEPRPFGVWNVKLMKCGGVGPALRIARAAERHGIELMWGCMDESVISISAALHAACASRATAYLDLDGSLDLVGDPARGGFELSAGRMRTLAAPGLGAELDL